EVAAQLNACEMNRGIRLDDGYLRSVAADDERVAGDQQGRVPAGNGEIDLGKHPGHEDAAYIFHLHFREQRAGRGVEGVGGPRDLTIELPPGDIADGDDGALPRFYGLRVTLRKVDIRAQGSGLRHAKEQ